MDPAAQRTAPPFPMMQAAPTAPSPNGTNVPSAVPVQADGSGSQTATDRAMTEDEIALYDRQIRLWGMRAQERIRSAHVLLITIRALGNEIAKNLVLAGIGSLTIVDHQHVTEADLGAQFPQRAAAAGAAAAAVVGMNRAVAASVQLRAMNPRVRVFVDESDIRTKGPGFFAPFNLVIATDLNPDVLNIINTATRLVDRPFYAAHTYGYFGYIFADLIEHDFVIVRDRPNVPTQVGTRETPTRTVINVQAQPSDEGSPTNPASAGAKNAAAAAAATAKETVTKRELYSTWLLASDVARLPAAFMSSARRVRSVTPYLPCLRALWEFQQIHAVEDHRLPNPQSVHDIEAFTRLVSIKQKTLGTPEVKAEQIRLFLQGIAGREIAPVATTLGGQLAQDVINTLGQTQQPIQNLMVFDGFSAQAPVYALHPEGLLGRQLLSAASATPEAMAAAMAAAAAAEAAANGGHGSGSNGIGGSGGSGGSGGNNYGVPTTTTAMPMGMLPPPIPTLTGQGSLPMAPP
ncbi:sumo activating enzyme [Niveomyces insectorum RCEF 264]|uniref:Ubiquitin-like 1-activating enzyme E1A n=1 Tax=Niveomyces insectorum RCEF 264 TaxID=1081102 RepID=A0A167M9L6_9HYPO|nr:sumo activating enzyme [Niveomyces insectorum RCEF 264]